MAVVMTQHGDVRFFNWGYQLQGKNGAPLSSTALARPPHDLLVIDFSRDGSNAGAFSPTQVSAMIAGDPNRVLVSYISIGEISEFRDEWSGSWTTNGKADAPLSASAPDFIGPVNPDWPESRKVRYWDQGWQSLIYNDSKTGWLDKIVGDGFDAAYLEIVDAFYFWGAEAKASEKIAGDPRTSRSLPRGWPISSRA